MRKFIFAAILGVLGLAGRADAMTLTYEKAYSTGAVVGVSCTTGTAVEITSGASTMPSDSILGGFVVMGYRVHNLDTSNKVFIGFNSNVAVSGARVGAPIPAGGNMPQPLGLDADTALKAKLYCIGAAAAGGSGVQIAVEIWGYK